MSRWFTLLLALPIFVLGCGSRQETTQTGTESSAQQRTEYEGTAERRLAGLGARIDSLKAELDVAGAETKAAIQSEIDELELKRHEAGRKLDELRAAGADRWEVVRGEMANLLDDLDQRFDRMRARVRGGQG